MFLLKRLPIDFSCQRLNYFRTKYLEPKLATRPEVHQPAQKRQKDLISTYGAQVEVPFMHLCTRFPPLDKYVQLSHSYILGQSISPSVRRRASEEENFVGKL